MTTHFILFSFVPRVLFKVHTELLALLLLLHVVGFIAMLLQYCRFHFLLRRWLQEQENPTFYFDLLTTSALLGVYFCCTSETRATATEGAATATEWNKRKEMPS